MPRVALSIRAQLLLVLTVFLALPWLGVEYVRELERVLRDAQERTLAGTAQAVATALHDRPRLFATPPDPIASFARERSKEAGSGATLPPSASPEIAQIIEGLSRTTARIWVIDRDGVVLARAGSLAQPVETPPDSWSARLSRATVGRLYALFLGQPYEDFADDAVRGMGALAKDKHLMPWRIEDELRRLGANYVQGGLWRGFAVRDGNLITGQQNFSGAETAELVIETLGR